MTLEEHLKKILDTPDENTIPPATRQAFTRRLQEGNYTRDENPASHLCVYFAAYDPKRGEVFLGHHIKSNIWLFNGGHIDPGETPPEAVIREIGEEWGMTLSQAQIGDPRFLSVTEIDNMPEAPCRLHYDIWYFVAVDKAAFTPDLACLNEEFHQTRWLDRADAQRLITCTSSLQALDRIFELVQAT